MSCDHDLIMPGGDSTGITAEMFGNGLGKRFTLIDKQCFGGECTRPGCVPSKSLLHAEATSFLFRFVDDIELYFPVSEKVIHVRSASRAGYSDLGVNRTRVEEIRKRFPEL